MSGVIYSPRQVNTATDTAGRWGFMSRNPVELHTARQFGAERSCFRRYLRRHFQSGLAILVIVAVGACDRPPAGFSTESAFEIVDSLSAMRDRGPTQGAHEVCQNETEPDADTVSETSSDVLLYAALHLRRLGFSCTVRSVRHVGRSAMGIRIDAASELVAWREGRASSATAALMAVSYHADPDRAPDAYRLWPIVVGLEGIRAFVESDATDDIRDLVVTIGDVSDWAADFTSTWLQPFPSPHNDTYSTQVATSGPVGPAPPVMLASAPGWVIGTSAEPVSEAGSLGFSGMGEFPILGEPSPANRTLLRSRGIAPMPFRLVAFASDHQPIGRAGSASVPGNSASVLRGKGDAFVRALRAAAAPSQPAWTMEGHWYWLLGICLPLILVGLALQTIVINTRTRLSNVEKAIAKLGPWLRRSDDALVKRAEQRQTLDEAREGFRAVPKRLRAWLWLKLVGGIVHRRHLRDDLRRRKADYLSHLEVQNNVLKKRQKLERGDGSRLFGGVWQGVATVLAKGGVVPLVIGGLTAAGSLVAVHWLEIQVQQQLLSDSLFDLGFLLPSVAAAYVVGCLLAQLLASPKDRHNPIAAFAWGSSLVVYLGLNAVELSGFDDAINNLYDSQTIDMMFASLAMVLISREILYSRRKERQESQGEADYTKELDAVSDALWFASSGERREALLRSVTGVVYLGLAAHCVWRGFGVALNSEQAPVGLVPVTAVTAVALLVPLATLFLGNVPPAPTTDQRISVKSAASILLAIVGSTLACADRSDHRFENDRHLAAIRIDMRAEEDAPVVYRVFSGDDGSRQVEQTTIDRADFTLPTVRRRDTVVMEDTRRRQVRLVIEDSSGADMMAIWRGNDSIAVLRADGIEPRRGSDPRVVERWFDTEDDRSIALLVELPRCWSADLVVVRRFSGRAAMQLVGHVIEPDTIVGERLDMEVLTTVTQQHSMPRCCTTSSRATARQTM